MNRKIKNAYVYVHILIYIYVVDVRRIGGLIFALTNKPNRYKCKYLKNSFVIFMVTRFKQPSFICQTVISSQNIDRRFQKEIVILCILQGQDVSIKYCTKLIRNWKPSNMCGSLPS